MTDQPLHPFSPPASLIAFLPNSISIGTLVQWALYIVFAFWAIYTLVAIYHWLKYSHASWVAFPAIAAHLFISFALMAYALSGTINV
ncbi:MAG: hypothetical protein AUJ45_01375 [Parcubacteria group bacterium CG1_02_50_68]|nr:MAG: hypothetical protein AUJ45_01375 [Parcubacteria group bacterium CG1_02_50_68]